MDLSFIFRRTRFRARFQAGFRARFRARFYATFELFRPWRRLSLLQTICARRYEKRTQQAELVGKNVVAPTNWQDNSAGARQPAGRRPSCPGQKGRAKSKTLEWRK